MPSDSQTAATSATPVSRFAGTLMDILDRVEYSRVRMDVTDNPIYRLRYEAYRREESVPFNDAGVVVDDLDNTSNGMSFGVHIDGQLVSSIRLHYLTSAQRRSPSMNVFPDILSPMLDQGDRFIDPSRFTADYEASLAYPALPFLTLRIAVMATVHFGATMCLSLVRPEHTAFYRRVFQSEAMSDVRSYPGLAFPVTLFGARVEERRHHSIFSRYPFFMSTPEEREKLFAWTIDDEDFETPQRATSRLAYERALLEANFGGFHVAAE
jgi:hypothetical protein